MKILVVMALLERQQEKMRECLRGHEVRFAKAPTDEEVAGTDVIVGNLAPARLKGAAALKLMQLNSAGSNDYLPLIASRPDVVLTCATGCYGKALSEHMLAMALMLIKNLNLYRDDEKTAEWRDLGPVRSLTDMKVLCLGMGDAGSRFARLANALGAKVSGVRRKATEDKPDYVEKVYGTDELDRILPEFDMVAMSMPETDATRGIMNRDRLMKMKEGSYILNVGRGSAIDQEALLECVKSGRIAGAGLDVTTPEPLPKDSPLWQEPRIVVTPHISGQFHLEHTRDAIVDLAIRNIKALENGEAFTSRVDLARGY